MPLIYQSTRDENNKVTASQAILEGLAKDGGLYTPIKLPTFDLNFNVLKKASYQEIAKLILTGFLDDFSTKEIDDCILKAYNDQFDTSDIVSIVNLKNHYNLELFHGPTLAFKDLALSILPHLLTTAAKKQNVTNKLVILTATSGDTGKAAMAGFSDVKNTEIIVFYPKDGVSRIQELQMVTQKGKNTHVFAVEGNFDDAQTKVKKIFNNKLFKQDLLSQGFQFSSANSMNIGRLVPQIVYYVYSYAQLVKENHIKSGDFINVTVPTGNFGNILAAYYAKQIGVPIGKLICASNENKVLTDFFKTGIYDKNRSFKVTSSPSMDILVSSNLERLLFHLLGNNASQTKELMEQLNEKGEYQIRSVDDSILDLFEAGYASEDDTAIEIKKIYTEERYVEDPHTAVASNVYSSYRNRTGDKTPTIIASTASPYKFPQSVITAITGKNISNDFDAISKLCELSEVPIPASIEDLKILPILHKDSISIQDMEHAVEKCLL